MARLAQEKTVLPLDPYSHRFQLEQHISGHLSHKVFLRPGQDSRLINLRDCGNGCQYLLGLVLRPQVLQSPYSCQDHMVQLFSHHAWLVRVADCERETV